MKLSVWLAGVLLCWFGISDFKEKAIPVRHLIIGGVFVAAALLLDPEEQLFYYMAGAMPGMCMVAMAFFAKGKMGYADGIVMIFLGILRGFVIGIRTLMLGLVLILAFFLILFLLKKAERNTTLPFVPFLFFSWCLVEGMEIVERGNVL